MSTVDVDATLRMYGSPITLSYARFSMTMTTTRVGCGDAGARCDGGGDADCDGDGTGVRDDGGGEEDAAGAHAPARMSSRSAAAATHGGRKDRCTPTPYDGIADARRPGWCPGRDSNPYNLAVTSPSSWRVYQFHHLGTWPADFT